MIPRIIDDIVEEMGDNLDRLVDLPHTFTHHFKQYPQQLNTLYLVLTRAELYRLSWTAALLQFFFATLLGYLWLWMPSSWLIPEWTLPLRVLLFPFGLAMSAMLIAALWQQSRLRTNRKHAIASSSRRDLNEFLCNLTENLLSPVQIARVLITGSKSRHTHLLIKRHVNTVLDDISLRTFSQVALGPEGYAEIKHSLAERIPELYLEALTDARFNAQRCETVSDHLKKQAESDAAWHYDSLSEPFFVSFQRSWIFLFGTLSTTLGALVAWWL
jgi:hypothetical protein